MLQWPLQSVHDRWVQNSIVIWHHASERMSQHLHPAWQQTTATNTKIAQKKNAKLPFNIIQTYNLSSSEATQRLFVTMCILYE